MIGVITREIYFQSIDLGGRFMIDRTLCYTDYEHKVLQSIFNLLV